VSRLAVSQRTCGWLLEAGLVRGHWKGTGRLYRLNPGVLSARRAYLESPWNMVLGEYRDTAEHEAG